MVRYNNVMKIRGIIPIKQQTPMGCFIASLQIVLNFWNENISYQEIDKALLKDDKGGSYLTELAWLGKTKGYQVDCYAYNLSLLDPKDSTLSETELLIKLEDRYKEYKSEWHKTLCASTIRCVKAGVNYIMKKPSLDDMKSYLNKSIPLIVTVNFTALYNKKGDPFAGHDVILIGIEKKKVYYIDPYFGEEKATDLDNFMFALMQRRIVEASAYMIAIYKNKPIV
jgi:uncharacterized protein YvpB